MPADRVPLLGVYGTLQDAEVRHLVLGRCRARVAILPDWERVYVAGEIYPGIRRRVGAETDVLILDGLSGRALARGESSRGLRPPTGCDAGSLE